MDPDPLPLPLPAEASSSSSSNSSPSKQTRKRKETTENGGEGEKKKTKKRIKQEQPQPDITPPMGLEDDIEEAILSLAQARGLSKTFCPRYDLHTVLNLTSPHLCHQSPLSFPLILSTN